MILELDDWHLGYDQIVKDTRSEGAVWILVNGDADAMGAARIFTYMLRADSVPYQLHPCWSYSSLTSLLKKDGSQDIRALVLLNLGASRNLTSLYDEGMLSAEARIYVMDCRKPVHLGNVHAGHNVVLFWDETQNKEDLPSDGDNLSGNDSTTDEDDDSSSDEESDSDSEDEDPDEGEAEFGEDEDTQKESAKVEVKSTSDDEDQDYDGEDEEEVDDDDDTKKRSAKKSSMSPTKRHKKGNDEDATDEEAGSPEKDNSQQESTLTPRELHKQRRNRLRAYYSGGNFYGSPVAWVAYRLASQKRWKDNADLLWLACIGLTDAYNHARIDVAGYTSLAMDLKGQCQRIFPNEMVDRVDKTIYAESLMGNDQGTQTQVTMSDNGKILAESDFRFFLLRHSSLYDSMLYSNYVASHLQVWKSHGRARLQELLAKMGFPLEECKQPYAFMNPHLKRKLRDKMGEYASEYGLDNLEFTSFNRVTGYKSLVSATDMSYAVTGLLESESTESFHAALDALNAKAIPNTMSEGQSASTLVNGGNLSSGGIGAGLLKAMALQKQIVTTATGLVERHALKTLRHFRYAAIECTSQEAKDNFLASNKKDSKNPTHHVFAQPLALTRLAHFLMDMHRENGKWTGSKSRPLVLCAENPVNKTYVVVGYEFPDRHGMFLKNHFGQHFQMTCNSMQGNFKLDSFDSHVVEVDAADVQKFIEQLHYMMEST